MKYFKNFHLSRLLIGAALFLPPITSFAQQRCEGIFQTASYGQLRSDFEHNTKYSNETPMQSEVKNQCQFGTCHLHSWASSLEHDFREHHNGTEIKLSMHYLTVKYWLLKSFDLLDQKDNRYNVQLGTDSVASLNTIRLLGLMPDNIWTATRSFQEGILAERLQTYVNNIIAHTKWARNKETNKEKKQAITDEGKSQIMNLFIQLIGPIPQEFEFNGQTYTPHSFARTFFPQLSKSVITVELNQNPKGKTYFRKSNKDNLRLKATPEDIAMTIHKLIEHGQNVYLVYDHQPAYVDNNTGIMSPSAFITPEGAAPLTAKQRQLFAAETEPHAVQIVGCDIDPKTNKMIKLKIKGSWGEKYGDHGYYHMYADYFYQFGLSISFYAEDENPN